MYLDGNQLIHVKEGCWPGDTRARFFVYVTPVDVGDLPEPRRRYGFENRNFSRAGLAIGGQQCAVRQWLPEYPIRRIRTGQFVKDDGGKLRSSLGKGIRDGAPRRGRRTAGGELNT